MTSYLAIVRVVTDDNDDELSTEEIRTGLAHIMANAPFLGAVGLAVLGVTEEQG